MDLHRRRPPRNFAPALCAAFLLGTLACGAAVDADEASEILRLLDLRPGSTVADVGAGDGEWTAGLAAAVGDRGRVWATEVTEELVEELQDVVDGDGLQQVRVVLGDDLNTGLPEACCDAVLLRMVYHHFTDPGAMRADLRRSLKPGGRLLIIDIVPQIHWEELEGVPDRGGHGIPLEALVDEMTGDGFREVGRTVPWNDDSERYAVVFEPAS
ncbi:MAG: methyltransferase domain-containing protein [Acidobacteriota bacterium]